MNNGICWAQTWVVFLAPGLVEPHRPRTDGFRMERESDGEREAVKQDEQVETSFSQKVIMLVVRWAEHIRYLIRTFHLSEEHVALCPYGVRTATEGPEHKRNLEKKKENP